MLNGADEIFEEMRFDPLRTAIEIIPESVDLRDNERLVACVQLANYRYAKKKELQMAGALSLTSMTDEELSARVMELEKALQKERGE